MHHIFSQVVEATEESFQLLNDVDDNCAAILNHLSNHGTQYPTAGNKMIFWEIALGQKYAFEYDYLGDMRIIYFVHKKFLEDISY